MVEYKCPHCGKRMSVPSSSQGSFLKCPHCRNLVRNPIHKEARGSSKGVQPSEDQFTHHGPSQEQESICRLFAQSHRKSTHLIAYPNQFPAKMISHARHTFASSILEDETPLFLLLDDVFVGKVPAVLITDRCLYSQLLADGIPLARIEAVGFEDVGEGQFPYYFPTRFMVVNGIRVREGWDEELVRFIEDLVFASRIAIESALDRKEHCTKPSEQIAPSMDITRQAARTIASCLCAGEPTQRAMAAAIREGLDEERAKVIVENMVAIKGDTSRAKKYVDAKRYALTLLIVSVLVLVLLNALVMSVTGWGLRTGWINVILLWPLGSYWRASARARREGAMTSAEVYNAWSLRDESESKDGPAAVIIYDLQLFLREVGRWDDKIVDHVLRSAQDLVRMGLPDSRILEVLVDAGVDPRGARELLERAKKPG